MSDQDYSGDIHPPYRRKNGFKELEEMIENHMDAVTTRLRGFFSKALFGFAVLGLTSAFALFGFGLTLSQQGETSDKIQQQRYDTVYDNCRDQNRRHNRAIAKARKILPSEAQQTVKILVDELQPYNDNCGKLAASRVKGTE